MPWCGTVQVRYQTLSAYVCVSISVCWVLNTLLAKGVMSYLRKHYDLIYLFTDSTTTYPFSCTEKSPFRF